MSQKTENEIIENMLNFLKEAMKIEDWESFKKIVDNAQTCADLQIPTNLLETGRCIMFQEQAEQYLRTKKAAVCKQKTEESSK